MPESAVPNINTDIENVELGEDFVEWGSGEVSVDEYNAYLNEMVSNGNSLGINTTSSLNQYNAIAHSLDGIFGMPYQFSDIVDPVIEQAGGPETIGRKFNSKIFSIMPILFLTPGEPKFMDGYGKEAKAAMAGRLAGVLGEDDTNADFDDGRYYSFTSNFPLYKQYANVALRALAMYMGIGDMEIPVPGRSGGTVVLKNIDVEGFMNTAFTKLFGSQATVPFFLDAETSISESFSNSTTESIVAQTVNGYSQAAREIQFIMGSKDSNGVLTSIGNAVTDVASNLASAVGDLGEVVAGKNILSRVANELTTIVTGGKIIFPEIWSDSEYDRSYDITIKLRSPDPDPVSIFLNIYMPIILLISMAAPHQIGNSSNSYESPFLVRATYKSIFSCDLGIISSLSISKGGPGNWNVFGQPTYADISLSIKDLYSSMFISKRMGLICNTAQMDYLATMAGVDMNEYEPTRMIKLALQILGDTPRDWASNVWGGIKSTLNKAAANVLSAFSDTRFLS